MNMVLRYVLSALLAVSAAAQNPAGGVKSAAGAAIGGVVRKEPGGEPVKKALIELIAENQAEGGDYTAMTGADGTFRIEGILPGRYHLFAEHTGFLEVTKSRTRSEGRVLTLTAGQELKDLQIHLQAGAVVRGRVTDEDGDPMAEAQVAVLKQGYKAGRSRWEQVGSERTNDLGEFRIANLAAGSYYVSVSPPPDFKNLIAGAGAAKPEPSTATAATSYPTTYYPGTADRGQAAAIELHPGDDFPVSFSLTPSPSWSIRGSVVNLPPQSSASIMLQSRDLGSVLNGAEMQKDGSFVIRDVSPGSYTILATVENAATPMIARESLQVANSIDGLRLAPQPGAAVHGHLRVEGKGSARVGEVFLSLQPSEPVDDSGSFFFGGGFSNLTRVGNDGSAEWKGVPPGNYSVHLVGEGAAGQDWFVKAMLVGGADATESGINVNGAALAVDLVASTQGAVAEGVVLDQKGEPVANAVVVAAPEMRLRGRAERYRKTVTDQSGRFALRGVPPGDYTVLAWESVDGEAYLNPEFVKGYEAQGSSLSVKEGERKALQLVVIAAGVEQ